MSFGVVGAARWPIRNRNSRPSSEPVYLRISALNCSTTLVGVPAGAMIPVHPTNATRNPASSKVGTLGRLGHRWFPAIAKGDNLPDAINGSADVRSDMVIATSPEAAA